MADISKELAAIMSAVFGKDVRKSIYDAIDKINKASEKAIDSGTLYNPGDSSEGWYDRSLYINTSTDRLLRSNGTNWVDVGSIRGNGISEITGPVTLGLSDTYTIHYTDGREVEFVVHNGKAITTITMTTSSGLVDTYTINYNDGTTSTFSVKNGNNWYYGTLVSGEHQADTGFTLPFAVKAGDAYLNIAEDSIYTCKNGADANASSTWNYVFTITSSSTGTNQYTMLQNLPSINGVTLTGNKTSGDLNLDTWLLDGATPPQPVVKTIQVGEDTAVFTTAEMQAVVAGNLAVWPYFKCANNGVAPPTIKKVVLELDGSYTVKCSKIRAAQGATQCKLRIIR